MIRDIEKFKLDLNHFRNVVVPQDFLKYLKSIVLVLHQGIVAGTPGSPNGTPVLTGYARANWGLHIGRSGVPTTPVGERPVEGSSPLPVNAYFDVDAILAAAGINDMFFWIYNNVEYIEALEDGHSLKAPTGMVAHALNNLQGYGDGL